jgi:hypothetical protein
MAKHLQHTREQRNLANLARTRTQNLASQRTHAPSF